MNTQNKMNFTDFLNLEEAVLLIKNDHKNKVAFEIGLQKIKSYLGYLFAGWCKRNDIAA